MSPSVKTSLGEKAPEVLVPHRHVALRIGLLRILFRLDDDPARIFGNFLEDADIVDPSVAGHGVDTGENAIEERPVLLRRFAATLARTSLAWTWPMRSA